MTTCESRMNRSTASAWMRRVTLLCVSLVSVGALAGGLASSAGAAACSTSSGAASCTIGTSVQLTAGTLTVEASPNLYWNLVGNGYDQWASGSATALTSCSATGTGTTCSSGSSPKMIVLDATGSGSGWALSEYLSSSDIPANSKLHFNGAGSATMGNSTDSPIGTDPFAATTPIGICDYGSTCTAPTAAAACSHAGLGFSTCPTYPDDLGIATGNATTQVDLYSAAASSGMGAVCFATGTASSSPCGGATQDAFWNLGVSANATAGSYATTVINLAVTSGP